MSDVILIFPSVVLKVRKVQDRWTDMCYSGIGKIENCLLNYKLGTPLSLHDDKNFEHPNFEVKAKMLLGECTSYGQIQLFLKRRNGSRHGP